MDAHFSNRRLSREVWSVRGEIQICPVEGNQIWGKKWKFAIIVGILAYEIIGAGDKKQKFDKLW